MINKQLVAIEKAGKDSFTSGQIKSYRDAEREARKRFGLHALATDLFIAGWNQAFWDEQERVLSER